MRIAAYVVLGSLLLASAPAQGKARTIHVFVALCDNEHQGIVPVPKALGNGDDPANNLYWGAMYGTKSFLKRSSNWTLVATEKKPTETILERVVFKHASSDAYLVADAYRGREIKKAVQDFLDAAAGRNAATLRQGADVLGLHGAADLVVYIGHNGLMDFNVTQPREPNAGPRQAIVLACKSKPYFQPRLAELPCRSILLTTGFMAPEAYTLDAAVTGWLARESGSQIADRAARAYHKYQKCGLIAARRLFFAGE